MWREYNKEYGSHGCTRGRKACKAIEADTSQSFFSSSLESRGPSQSVSLKSPRRLIDTSETIVQKMRSPWRSWLTNDENSDCSCGSKQSHGLLNPFRLVAEPRSSSDGKWHTDGVFVFLLSLIQRQFYSAVLTSVYCTRTSLIVSRY